MEPEISIPKAPWRPAPWLILPESLGDGLIPSQDVIEMAGAPRPTFYRFERRLSTPGRRVYSLIEEPDWKGTWRE